MERYLIITITTQIDPAHVQDVIDAYKEHGRVAAATEPGLLRFDVHQDQADPTRIVLYEAYASDAAHAAHVAGDSHKRARGLVELADRARQGPPRVAQPEPRVHPPHRLPMTTGPAPGRKGPAPAARASRVSGPYTLGERCGLRHRGGLRRLLVRPLPTYRDDPPAGASSAPRLRAVPAYRSAAPGQVTDGHVLRGGVCLGDGAGAERLQLARVRAVGDAGGGVGQRQRPRRRQRRQDHRRVGRRVQRPVGDERRLALVLQTGEGAPGGRSASSSSASAPAAVSPGMTRWSISTVQRSGTTLTAVPPQMRPMLSVGLPTSGWRRWARRWRRSPRAAMTGTMRSMALIPSSGRELCAVRPAVEMRARETPLCATTTRRSVGSPTTAASKVRPLVQHRQHTAEAVLFVDRGGERHVDAQLAPPGEQRLQGRQHRGQGVLGVARAPAVQAAGARLRREAAVAHRAGGVEGDGVHVRLEQQRAPARRPRQGRRGRSRAPASPRPRVARAAAPRRGRAGGSSPPRTRPPPPRLVARRRRRG